VSNRATSQLAYILHKRAFRDTSQILEIFSRDHGRFSLMSRGSRNPGSRQNSLLQLHRPLLLGWSGRGEMPLLVSAEPAEEKAPRLAGRSLMSAMYIDELIMYLLHRHDINESLFQLYHDSLYALQQVDIEPVLRLFEKRLLDCLGFSLHLESDADSGEPLREDLYYRYLPEHGPVAVGASRPASTQTPVLQGRALLAYAANHLDDPQMLQQIKQLTRHVLSHHLAGRKLRSRELFRRPVAAPRE